MLFPTGPALSAWSTDPTVNNPVCTATNSQLGPQLISDGSGGAIITWSDWRSGTYYDIYAQRLDSSGNALWTTDGVPVCTAPYSQASPQLISDGSGGAIITWSDSRGSTHLIYDIYAQRLDASGNALWNLDGVSVCSATGFQSWPKLISDTLGGAIITWYDYRGGTYSDIYAQRLDASGNALWTTDGVPVCTATNYQYFPELISDGSGGAIITWEDNRSRTYHIYAQRLDSSGNPLWTTDGVLVSSYGGSTQLTSDGSGGAIIVMGGTDIYAQRIDASGNVLWTANGVPVCTATYDQLNPQLITDGSGGAIFTWEDSRGGGNYDYYADIYTQRLDSSGNALWTADGVLVCMAPYAQRNPQLITDGSGGAIITWSDFRNGTNDDIYAQRLDASGNALWTNDGVAVCTATYDQLGPQLISDGSGGAIITWSDWRSGTYYDIYAQRVSLSMIASLLVPWYNDWGGPLQFASFITVFNSSSQTITLTVTYMGPGNVDATPQANTFIIRPSASEAGRPFQVSGIGEGLEQGPPLSMPNATSSAPFGSATFTAQVPIGSKLYGDTLRMGAIDLDLDGTPETFSGIAPAYSK